MKSPVLTTKRLLTAPDIKLRRVGMQRSVRREPSNGPSPASTGLMRSRTPVGKAVVFRLKQSGSLRLEARTAADFHGAMNGARRPQTPATRAPALLSVSDLTLKEKARLEL